MVITWENKRELITLLNLPENKENREKMLDFVISNMEDFDHQAWDMFITGVGIIEDEIIESISHHAKVYEKIKSIGLQSFVSNLRILMYTGIIEKHQSKHTE